MKGSITTTRLIVEEASREDAPFFFRLLRSPTWLRFIGDRGIHSLGDAKNYIQYSLITSYREKGFGLYKVSLLDSTPIGVCGFLQRDYLDSADLGYALLPEFEGHGYMVEAARSIIEYGYHELRLKEILAFTDPDNYRSHQVLGKLGFVEKEVFFPPDFSEPCILFKHIRDTGS